MFARDPSTGALTYVETEEDMGACQQVVVSSDGRNVYAARTYSGTMYQHVSVGCPPAPLDPCRQAGASDLKIQKGATPARDAVKWSWRKGEATTAAEFGSAPLASTDFALCVYVGGSLRTQARAPAGGGCGTRPCWRSQATHGYRYADRLRTPDGVKTLLLRAGGAGSAKVGAVLGGESTPLPALPIGAPVTVRLVNGEGGCWGATYPTATVDGPTLFRASD